MNSVEEREREREREAEEGESSFITPLYRINIKSIASRQQTIAKNL
jgi:hypothetical protein